MVDENSARPTRVFTIHNNVLYIDPASSRLRHGPVGSSPVNAGIVSSGDMSNSSMRRPGFLNRFIASRTAVSQSMS
jgi:hypothetical protein